MTDLLQKGYLIPGSLIEWNGKLYMVAGCEFWPQWLERQGKHEHTHSARLA